MSEPVLVYVDAPWAYFADAIEGTWGDDWDDAPYDCNAGEPYAEFVRLKVAYDGPLETPTQANAGRLFPPYGVSVEQINNRVTPWLADFLGNGRFNKVQIWAGVGVRDFARLIEESGGHVWVPMDGVPWVDRVLA